MSIEDKLAETKSKLSKWNRDEIAENSKDQLELDSDNEDS